MTVSTTHNGLGVTIAQTGDYITVTFDRKPNTDIQRTLRSTGLCRQNKTEGRVWRFHYSADRWNRAITALVGKS